MKLGRSSGLLLHITALPSPYGVGDLGHSAYRFADALEHAGQSWWQVLPIGPAGYGYSPYSGISTFAGAPLLISPELLAEEGLLCTDDLANPPSLLDNAVDYPNALLWKNSLLDRAFARFKSRAYPDDFGSFCRAESYWLHHYAAFATLRHHYNTPWPQWPAVHRMDVAQAVHYARTRQTDLWEAAHFRQYTLHKQWQRLRAYCRNKGIRIIGDMPIYVSHDSADVWAAQDQYHLDAAGNPVFVGGVPPDFFSETGQRWGNPLYRWDIMRQRNFDWWQNRFRRACSLFDLIRLDHFRGFAGYWEIPASEETAVRGRWADGPGAALFDQLKSTDGTLPVIAEDLGVITEDVRMLMHRFNIPGMAVLQFAFDGDKANPHLPHNYHDHLAAYTGTHDNDTLVGWLNSALEEERARACQYLKLTKRNVCWQAIRTMMASGAGLVITPVQDVLGLGSDARMNTPGTVVGNWQWRMRADETDLLLSETGARLQTLTVEHARGPKAL